MPQAVHVLEAVAARFGHRFEFKTADVGGAAIDKTGRPLPDDTLRLAKESDAILLGAVGGPKWEGLDYSVRPERALLGLREQLGLYANLRPAKLYSMLADASTLKREVIEGLDILVVRELTGGIYFGKPKGIEKTSEGEKGVNTEVYTTPEIRRIAKVAFEAARKRRRCKPAGLTLGEARREVVPGSSPSSRGRGRSAAAKAAERVCTWCGP